MHFEKDVTALLSGSENVSNVSDWRLVLREDGCSSISEDCHYGDGSYLREIGACGQLGLNCRKEPPSFSSLSLMLAQRKLSKNNFNYQFVIIGSRKWNLALSYSSSLVYSGCV